MDNLSINELESMIKKYSTQYYTGESDISDQEFDHLVDLLRKLDPDNELLSTTGWGMTIDNDDEDLVVPMTGISDKRRYSQDTIYDCYEDTVVCTPKLDGLAMQLVYSDGKLIKAMTRHNGVKGKDKLNHIKNIVPNELLFNKGVVVISGEVVMDYDTFSSRYDVETQHPRNIASGIINRTDTSDDDDLLTFVAYRILKIEDDNIRSMITTYKSMMDYLFYQGFYVVRLISNVASRCLGDIISQGTKVSNSKGSILTDGLVFTNKIPKVNSDGTYSYDGTYAVKTDNEYADTVVTGINWSMGSTGRYVPTALLEPVSLGGCVIRRATANNIDWCKSRNLGVGSKVRIIRSGEIIPKIVDVLTSSDNLVQPDKCVYCGKDLVKVGADLSCNNPSCEGRLGHRLHRFIDTFSSGVKGVGWKLVEDIITENNIRCIEDIFRISTNKYISSPKKTDKIKYEVLKKMTEPRSVDYFLVGVSVPRLSWKGAFSYASKTNICDLLSGNDVDVVRPPHTNRVSLEYIYDNLDYLRELYSLCNISSMDSNEDSGNQSENKIRICITGSLENYHPRSKIFEEFSDRLIDSDVKSCDYLVTNNPEGSSSKLRKARDLSKPIVTEEYLISTILGVKEDSNG